MNYRWSLAPEQPVLTEKLAGPAGISPLLAQCLVNRGFSEPESIFRFLNPRLKNLSDPFLLPDMGAAVDRLLAARARREPVVIFGDYDVDGVTSTALLTQVFRALDMGVFHYLPHRLEEGYGLSQEGVKKCLEKHPARLLLAVDCGSTAVETIAWLNLHGVDVVVLDHHQVSSPPPDALALVNPQRLAGDQDEPPFSSLRSLSSVGLAFKLSHALLKRGRDQGIAAAHAFDLRVLLDFVALGTVADLVPLAGENRILVRAGLEGLNRTLRPGLQALKAVAQAADPIAVYSVGYQLAPRLNAAGRLEDAEAALRLLVSTDPGESNRLAAFLDSSNRERQSIEKTMASEAIGAVRSKFNAATDYVIVEGQLLWHIGVVGIVASRVLKQFYRPTIILGGDGGVWRGSGRSIEGFDIAAALRQCHDLLLRHGGHAMAAGLSIDCAKIDDFRVRLNAVARQTLRPEQLKPRLALDAVVRLSDMTEARVVELSRLEPTGQGNAAVQLMARQLRCQSDPVRIGKEQKHVKLRVTDGTATQEAIWWGMGDNPTPAGVFDLAFVPKINEFNGRRTVQLNVVDWRPA